MELRAYAQRESKSLNQVLLEMRTAGLGVFRHQPRNAELLALAGTWVEDAATEKALGEMRMEENSLNMLYCPRTDTAVSETAVYEEV